MNEIVLADGDGNLAAVAPRLGAWLLRYVRQTSRHGPVEVLRYAPECLNTYPVMQAGSHLMFPVAGYTRAGDRADSYRWRGTDRPMPIHGFARGLPWTITEVTAVSATLILQPDDRTREIYPFEFRLALQYGLRGGALTSTLRVENLGDGAMPFSTGFHPYFRTPLTALGRREHCVAILPESREVFASAGIISDPERKARRLPVTAKASPARHFADFGPFRAMLGDELSDVSVMIDASCDAPFRCLTVWSPTVDAPFYCIEPRTALPDAFANAAANQLVVLAPGASFSAAMTLDLLEA